MKSERRHDLQNNTLAAWLSQYMKSAGGPLTSWVIAGVIAIVLVIVFVKVSGSRQEANQQKAWADLYGLQNQALAAMSPGANDEYKFTSAIEGLEGVAEEHAGKSLGLFANFAIADTYSQRGVSSLERSRQISNDAFEKAAEYYTNIIESRSASELMVNLARFRRGRSYEWRNQLSDAMADYEATKGPYTRVAKEQLLALKSPGMKEWYEEFDALDFTKPQAGSLQGLPDSPFSEPGDLENYLNTNGAANDPFGGSLDLNVPGPTDLKKDGDAAADGEASDDESSAGETEAPPAETESSEGAAADETASEEKPAEESTGDEEKPAE